MGGAHPLFKAPMVGGRAHPFAKGHELQLQPPAKTGMKWLRGNRTAPTLANWYKKNPKLFGQRGAAPGGVQGVRDIKWGREFDFGRTKRNRRLEERRELLAARGKFRTKKHEGKQKGRKSK